MLPLDLTSVENSDEKPHTHDIVCVAEDAAADHKFDFFG